MAGEARQGLKMSALSPTNTLKVYHIVHLFGESLSHHTYSAHIIVNYLVAPLSVV